MGKNTYMKLKALRIEYGYTQETFSQVLGIHEATYNRKEQGITQFTLGEAKTISNLFKLSIERIFFAKRVRVK